MEIPIQFPRPADVIAEQAQRFRRMSAAEQAREFAEVLETGFQQIRGHPRRTAIEAQILESEEAVVTLAGEVLGKRIWNLGERLLDLLKSAVAYWSWLAARAHLPARVVAW